MRSTENFRSKNLIASSADGVEAVDRDRDRDVWLECDGIVERFVTISDSARRKLLLLDVDDDDDAFRDAAATVTLLPTTFLSSVNFW